MKKEKKTTFNNISCNLLHKTYSSGGITLVALVVTIIVLLILAGVSITTLLGDNGIIKKAQEAANRMQEEAEKEQQQIADLENELGQTLGEAEIPEGLEIGSEVTYRPSGKYNWLHKYCSSTKAEKAEDGTDACDLLESGEGKDFNISSWKVLSINKTTGKVELVPSGQTSGTVYLGDAQGYNNGVKLLNEACSSLYENSAKGISARSINIEDIEKYITTTAVAEAHSYTNTDSNTTYGNQVSSAYSTSNSNYPVIYAQEKLAVIDGTPNGDTGLDLSDTPNSFIERTENEATDGKLTATTSIQPYQTYWYKDATYMSTAFENYTKQDGSTVNYYNLIMPSGTSTTYWVASHCVDTYSRYCYFLVRKVSSGGVGSNSGYESGGGSYSSSSLALFPVVTLNSKLISGDATSGFSVQ